MTAGNCGPCKQLWQYNRPMQRAEDRKLAVSDVFQVGGWLVRPELNEISRTGIRRRLRRQLMDLLVLLANRAGQVISRAEMIETIWGNRLVAETVLPRCIAELRKSLTEGLQAPISFIETIPKRGYRLTAPVLEPTAALVKTRQPTILIAPFRDISERCDQQYFCEGLAEHIINALTHVRGLRVIAQTSAFLFRHEAAETDAVKMRMSVDMILTGSVSRSDDRIRITVQLSDVSTESYVWSECYQREAAGIFDLEDEIALTVAEKLRVEILSYERNGVIQRYTADVAAHASYLEGLYHWNRRTPEETLLARQCFQKSIFHDPGYPLPYVALADCSIIAGFYGFAQARSCFSEARGLLSQALAKAGDLAQAHASLGFVTFLDGWDWTASQACFRRSMEFNPGYPVTYVWFALCQSWAGQAEGAFSTLDRAYLSDPLSPLLATTKGVLLFQCGRYEEAANQLRQVLEAEPDYSLAHLHLSRTLIALGDHDCGIDHAMKACALGFEAARVFIAFADTRARRKTQAKETLAAMVDASNTGYFPPALIGYTYLALGDRRNALRWFTEAENLADPMLRISAMHPKTGRWLSSSEVQALISDLRGITCP